MPAGRLVESTGNHFTSHRTGHLRYFFRTLIDEQHNQVTLRMLRRDGEGDVLQHHGFARLGRRNDHAALALAYGGDEIDVAGGDVLGAAIAEFHGQTFVGK